MNLNGPMVERLRRCAADTSPNWDGMVKIYPSEARELVALIDLVSSIDISESTQIVFDEADRMIYRLADGKMVISEGGAWLPGVYADLPAALRAFEVDDALLVELRDVANEAGGVITLAMLDGVDHSGVAGEPEATSKSVVVDQSVIDGWPAGMVAIDLERAVARREPVRLCGVVYEPAQTGATGSPTQDPVTTPDQGSASIVAGGACLPAEPATPWLLLLLRLPHKPCGKP